MPARLGDRPCRRVEVAFHELGDEAVVVQPGVLHQLRLEVELEVVHVELALSLVLEEYSHDVACGELAVRRGNRAFARQRERVRRVDVRYGVVPDHQAFGDARPAGQQIPEVGV